VRADDSGARLVSGEAIDYEKEKKPHGKIEAEEIRAHTHSHTKFRLENRLLKTCAVKKK